MNFDLHLDYLIGQHIRSVISQTQARKQASVIDLRLASLHVHILQSVVDQHDYTTYGVVPPVRRNNTLVAVDVLADSFRLRTSTITDGTGESLSQALVVEFGRFGCGVGTQDATQVPWHFLIGSSKISLFERDLQLSLGNIFTETQEYTPECAVPTVQTTMRLVDGLRASFARHAMYTQSTDQRIILTVINFVGNRTVVDPLSTTQPSYLIQSGHPHELRTDIGFKYLVFLRRCLESSSQEDRQVLHSILTAEDADSSIDGSWQLVRSCLPQFGADMDSLSFSSSSPLAFLVTNPEQDVAELSTGIKSVSLVLRRIHAVYSSPDRNDSEVLLSSAVVNACIRTTDWYEPHVASAHKSSMNLSTSDKTGEGMQHVSIIISLGDVVINFYPSLMNFAQHVIRVTKRTGLFMKEYGSQSPSTPAIPSPTSQLPIRASICYVDFILSSRSFRVKAGAQNLVIEYRAAGVDFICTSLLKREALKSSIDLSMNHSLTFKEARLQGCALADMSKPDEYAILAALVFYGGKLNVLARYQSDADPLIRVILGLDSMQLSVPRSAIRLYRFAQEWREDYLPGIEETVKSLLAELKPEGGTEVPKPPPSRARPVASWLPRNVEVAVASFRVSLQVMRGTWIAWELGGIMAYMASSQAQRGSQRRTFGMQIGYHTFIISSKDKPTDSIPNVRVKLPLPTYTATGFYDGVRLDGLALIETFTANIKPAHWDTLLTVQQKFGQDFGDLVSLLENSRPRDHHERGRHNHQPSLQYRVQGKMKGFSISLEGGSSMTLLECERIGGTAVQSGSGLSGHIELSDLALSLAPRTDPSSPIQVFDRSRRSAFVIIDILAEIDQTNENKGQLVNLAATKIHAVMQPSSIGQIGDFVDHLQVR